MTLNKDKYKFGVSAVRFLGHIVDKGGVRADPDKISAIVDLTPPKDLAELRRFMGMVNQLGKFSCHLADLTPPLHELLSPKHGYGDRTMRKLLCE